MLRFGSICSGIEAASLAWEPLGWKAAWFAEIEKFPSAVLAHRWPDVPNLGDMCQLPAMIRAGFIEAPPVLVGGTPCQAFSVAGARKGLDDPRGQLTLKFVEIADAIDEQRDEPCLVVWENVPGVLSDKSNAFGCFLAALVGEQVELCPPGGKWSNAGCVHGPQRSAAWRVLDAQYFGVAQRRRRVFVVASADPRIDPAKILFESDGVRRDSPPCRETGEEIAAAPTLRAGGNRTGGDRPPGTDVDTCESLVVMAHGQGNAEIRSDGEPSLTCNHEAPVVCGVLGQQSHSLTAEGHDASEDGTGRGTPVVAFSAADAGRDAQEAFTPPLRSCNSVNCNQSGHGQGLAVAFQPRVARNGRGGPSGIAYPLTAEAGKTGKGDSAQCVTDGLQVRRLMPVECERLQGVPDGHTAIPGAADGPRYKAIGNSKAVPVVRWLGRRIQEHLCSI